MRLRTSYGPSTAAIVVLLLGIAAALGCGRDDRAESAEAVAAPDAVSQNVDTVAEADTAANGGAAEGTDTAAAPGSLAEASVPDSLAKDAKEDKGFFARLFGKDDEEDEEKDELVPVELARVEVRDMPTYLGTTATLEPEKQADIVAKVAGEIRQILVEEGDQVKEGAVLAVLDGAAQEVMLEEAEARLRALQLDLDRIEKLHNQQLASDKDMHNARARQEEAQAQRNAAKLQLDYTKIVAPFSGQITERFVDQGQNVATGTRLFSIVDRDPLLVRIYLPEKGAGKVELAQEVVVRPDTDLDLEVAGRVLRIAPIVDARTGTVKVTCEIDGSQGRLNPGSFVRVSIQTDLHRNTLCIPKRALVPEGGETFVYRAAADSVLKIPVKTGYANGDLVEVVEGLDAGQRVVAVGQGALRSGTKIREVNPDRASLTDSEDETE
jgi:membrane fusion protein (multidrug efflux system)